MVMENHHQTVEFDDNKILKKNLLIPLAKTEESLFVLVAYLNEITTCWMYFRTSCSALVQFPLSFSVFCFVHLVREYWVCHPVTVNYVLWANTMTLLWLGGGLCYRHCSVCGCGCIVCVLLSMMDQTDNNATRMMMEKHKIVWRPKRERDSKAGGIEVNWMIFSDGIWCGVEITVIMDKGCFYYCVSVLLDRFK